MAGFKFAYQADVSKLSDQEIRLLIEECESSGALSAGAIFEPLSLEAAINARWHALIDEHRRRWDLANPESAIARREFFNHFKMMDAG